MSNNFYENSFQQMFVSREQKWQVDSRTCKITLPQTEFYQQAFFFFEGSTVCFFFIFLKKLTA